MGLYQTVFQISSIALPCSSSIYLSIIIFDTVWVFVDQGWAMGVVDLVISLMPFYYSPRRVA